MLTRVFFCSIELAFFLWDLCAADDQQQIKQVLDTHSCRFCASQDGPDVFEKFEIAAFLAHTLRQEAKRGQDGATGLVGNRLRFLPLVLFLGHVFDYNAVLFFKLGAEVVTGCWVSHSLNLFFPPHGLNIVEALFLHLHLLVFNTIQIVQSHLNRRTAVHLDFGSDRGSLSKLLFLFLCLLLCFNDPFLVEALEDETFSLFEHLLRLSTAFRHGNCVLFFFPDPFRVPLVLFLKILVLVRNLLLDRASGNGGLALHHDQLWLEGAVHVADVHVSAAFKPFLLNFLAELLDPAQVLLVALPKAVCRLHELLESASFLRGAFSRNLVYLRDH